MFEALDRLFDRRGVGIASANDGSKSKLKRLERVYFSLTVRACKFISLHEQNPNTLARAPINRTDFIDSKVL